MADFVTLTCPSCGGSLQITKDIDRFACGFCGAEHIVKRGGSIISLAPLADGLQQIKISQDRTTTELTIRRLRDEIADHEAEIIRLALEPCRLDFTEVLARLLGLKKLSFNDYMKRAKADTKDYDFPVKIISNLPSSELSQLISKLSTGLVFKGKSKKVREYFKQIKQLREQIEEKRVEIDKLKQSIN
jgi:hypothetical protein